MLSANKARYNMQPTYFCSQSITYGLPPLTANMCVYVCVCVCVCVCLWLYYHQKLAQPVLDPIEP